ncbi:MAG: permease-like cell division protein FtsX [Coriobacteriia bacterium]|nr:permease-like cell division protein FtsX [Coriobacteriia bacterium]
MATNAGYFLRESVQNFKRNWVMSLGAVITIYLSLLLVGVSFVTGYIVTDIVKSVEDKVTIQIFIKDGAATEDVQALQQWLSSDELAKSVNYTTKEEALEKLRKQMAQSPEILDQLGDNPLPASLDVMLKDPREVESMVARIMANDLFLKVADRPDDPEKSLKWGEGIVNKLFAFTNVVRIVEIVFIAMLSVVSLIFINNTIRLAIYARRKEIGIMRLVGASNWFIRTPFLMEGVIQSLIGAAMAILTIVTLQAAIMPRLREAVTFLPIDITSGMIVQISLILVGAGVLIGLAGSGFALRRYLKI